MQAIKSLILLTTTEPTRIPPMVKKTDVNDQQKAVVSAAISPTSPLKKNLPQPLYQGVMINNPDQKASENI
jgi:hypothetical protein